MKAWQATVQNDDGSVVINPFLTVYEDDGVTLAKIFDEDGNPKENPFIGTPSGFVQFFAEPGDYKVVGASGAELTPMWSITIASGEKSYEPPAAPRFNNCPGPYETMEDAILDGLVPGDVYRDSSNFIRIVV